jgi:hypothetical protein
MSDSLNEEEDMKCMFPPRSVKNGISVMSMCCLLSLGHVSYHCGFSIFPSFDFNHLPATLISIIQLSLFHSFHMCVCSNDLNVVPFNMSGITKSYEMIIL